jgi:hypothetical protein
MTKNSATTLILRRDPKTKEIVGFTIIDFAGHFAQKEPR